MDRPRDAYRTPVLAGAETIDLQEERSRGVLLLHGFGDTPQTLSLLARRLHSADFSVLAPLLPGHGRTMRAFTDSRADEWLSAARNAFTSMRERHESVSVVGLSMGGGLAVMLAAEFQDIPALVLISPYLGMPAVLRIAAATHLLWGRFVGEVNARHPGSVRDPIEREKNLAYGAVTGRSLFELWKVVRLARKALRSVEAPTLLIQSTRDPRCSPAVAEASMKRIRSRDKRIVWTEEGGHIITVDYGRELVFTETERWLEVHTRGGATAAAAGSAAVERPKS